MSQRQWAVGAFAEVVSMKEGGADAIQRCRTLCMNAPVLLRQAGALEGLAFLRRDTSGRDFVDALAKVAAHPQELQGSELVGQLASCSLNEYVTRSSELVAVAMWFRRFAQAELAE